MRPHLHSCGCLSRAQNAGLPMPESACCSCPLQGTADTLLMDNGAMEPHDSSWTDMTWKPLSLTTQCAGKTLSVLCLIYGKWAIVALVHFDKIGQKPERKEQAEHLVSCSHERLPCQVPKLRARAALARALQDTSISVTTMGGSLSFSRG